MTVFDVQRSWRHVDADFKVHTVLIRWPKTCKFHIRLTSTCKSLSHAFFSSPLISDKLDFCRTVELLAVMCVFLQVRNIGPWAWEGLGNVDSGVYPCSNRAEHKSLNKPNLRCSVIYTRVWEYEHISDEPHMSTSWVVFCDSLLGKWNIRE